MYNLCHLRLTSFLQKFKMIEVVCNDRLGKKVRVKCKYPFLAAASWMAFSQENLFSMPKIRK